MQPTEASRRLAEFRQEVYRCLGPRQDSLFEIIEALCTADGPQHLAHLSQAPGVRRRWPSFPDALAAGRLDGVALRRGLTATLPPSVADERPV